MKNRLHPWLIASAALLTSCSTDREIKKSVGWACLMENRSISRFMGEAANDFARGDNVKWHEIRTIWSEHRLDGIASTCFSIGLGEMFARSPNVFLERYIEGDEVAKELAREAYGLLYSTALTKGQGFDEKVARENALSIFRQRRSLANVKTKKRIDNFIAYIQTESTAKP